MAKRIGPEAADLDLVFEVGATFDKTFTYRVINADGSKGDPIDLTGYEVLSQARATPDAEEVLMEIGDFVTLGGTLGTIRFNIPRDDIIAFGVRTASWDFYLSKTGSPTIRLFKGMIYSSARTSRDE